MLSPLLLFVASSLPLAAVLVTSSSQPSTVAPLSSLVKSLNLCLASTVISITSVLNFSLAATLAVLLGLPLTFSSPTPPSSSGAVTRFIKYMAYIALGFGWIVWAPEETAKSVWNWEILGVWFAPFTCIVYAPLVLQAGIVCLLPSQ
jgi:GPI-anchor transamidase subunit GAA1